jgi:GDP-L-fucose synthase
MKTLLITGGGGFLGKHVLKALANTGVSYLAPRSSELDILDLQALSNYLAYHEPDTILHMSAMCGGIVKNSNYPADFLQINTRMAINIYEAAHKSNITNIYSIGSVCMYPEITEIPFKETDIWLNYPEKTNAPYGIAKRVLLMLAQTYRQQYGFTGANLIPVNMYGEHDSFDNQKSHVIPALIKKFLHAKDNSLPSVECLGSGGATREFLYAPDAAEVIVKVILTNFDCDQPINLGVGKDISIKNLAILIAKLTNYQGNIFFKDDGLDGQQKRLLDVSRAKKLLGWTAATSLEAGLIKTIDWYRHELAHGDV